MSLDQFVKDLECGHLRAAEPSSQGWLVQKNVKENILALIRAGKLVQMGAFVDKDTLPLREFSPEHKIRLIPGGTSVRTGAYLAPGVVVMPPSYINIGAFIDEGSMVDSHVLVGSCAQIGKRVHLSAGVQIGGVLEPVGQVPVVIEDDAFLGAHSAVLEGIRVGRRAVLAPGVILSRGIAIYDAVHERILEKGGAVPENAVVIPGSRPLKSSWAAGVGLQAYCPIIIKYRDEKSEASLVLEDALR